MMNHRIKCNLAALALTTSFALPVAAQETTVIHIEPQKLRGPISPLIYGTNHRYFMNGSGTWDAPNKRINPNFDKNHHEAAIKSIRYPAGTAASPFEWKNAIGPVEKRKTVQPASGKEYGMPQIATFGIDECARWCEQNGVTMVYMYGIANGNARDAADLVEYLNAPVGTNPNGGIAWAKIRADYGHPKPYGIKYFEIANEADGPNPAQRWWLNAIDTDENRAKRSLGLQAQRDSYMPEYVFGGTAKLEKQTVGVPGDLRAKAAKSDGSPNQQKQVQFFPIVPETTTVFVGDAAWKRVSDIKAATGQAFELNEETGRIVFGDGTHGDIPAKGEVVTVSYQVKRDGYVAYYPAMKAVDPTLQIFAGYESINMVKTFGSKNLYDGIVVHPYTNEYNVPKAETLEEWHNNLMLSSIRLGKEIADYQELIDKTVPPERRGKVKVICTEYGPNRQEAVMPPGQGQANWRFLDVGLYNGLQLMQWMRVGMPHAERHATTVGVFGPAPDFEITPAARAFQLFSQHFGDQLVGIDIKNNPERQTNVVMAGTGVRTRIVKPGTPNTPADAPLLKLPKLDAEASRDAQGNLYLAVINQDTTDDVQTKLQIAGWQTKGEAEVWTLNGPNFHAVNTKQNPNAVGIKATKTPLGNEVSYTFPAHSMTMIKFAPSNKALATKGTK